MYITRMPLMRKITCGFLINYLRRKREAKTLSGYAWVKPNIVKLSSKEVESS